MLRPSLSFKSIIKNERAKKNKSQWIALTGMNLLQPHENPQETSRTTQQAFPSQPGFSHLSARYCTCEGCGWGAGCGKGGMDIFSATWHTTDGIASQVCQPGTGALLVVVVLLWALSYCALFLRRREQERRTVNMERGVICINDGNDKTSMVRSHSLTKKKKKKTLKVTCTLFLHSNPRSSTRIYSHMLCWVQV